MKKDLDYIKNRFADRTFKDKKGVELKDRLENLKNKRFSDTISKDENGNILQWVNFVQEGGGVLGISLVGYVFVLEYLGIRFLRLAGTSAGAINTLFLASMGEKHDPKSPELFDMMMDDNRFNMKSFVDAGSGIVRFMIFSLSRGMGLISNILISYLALAALALIILPLLSYIGMEMKMAYLIFMAVFVLMSVIIGVLLSLLHRFRYGINPGRTFEEFLVTELDKSGITSQELLKKRAEGYMNISPKRFVNTPEGKVLPKNKADVPVYEAFEAFSVPHLNKAVPLNNNSEPIEPGNNLWYSSISSEMDEYNITDKKIGTEAYRPEENSGFPELYLIRDEKQAKEKKETAVVTAAEDSDQPAVTKKDKKKIRESLKKIYFDYSFVTTDIANQCKIVFPLDEDLYDFKKSVRPAVFVRASMAIPLFFEPKILPVNKGADWLGAKGNVNRSDTGVLIDGGSLSNFPINLFHLRHIKEPRVPVLGARIVDAKPVVNSRQNLTFGNYLGNVINTLRNNEDSSFLAINPFYKEHSIAEIKAYETKINWLNFNISTKEKEELFLKGVEAALIFLEKFDWKKYKADRKKLK